MWGLVRSLAMSCVRVRVYVCVTRFEKSAKKIDIQITEGSEASPIKTHCTAKPEVPGVQVCVRERF